MYKLMYTLVLSCLLMGANAQFRSIPAEVTESFDKKFPLANHVTWKDKITSFQAEFQEEKQKVRASFTSKGEWLKTEKNYDYAKLPAEVKDGFTKSKYASYKVREVSEIDDNEKGLQYVVVVKKGDLTKRNLYFTKSGQLVKDDVNF